MVRYSGYIPLVLLLGEDSTQGGYKNLIRSFLFLFYQGGLCVIDIKSGVLTVFTFILLILTCLGTVVYGDNDSEILDFDKDGDVDGWDYHFFLEYFTQGLNKADLNQDGIVNVLDINYVAAHYISQKPDLVIQPRTTFVEGGKSFNLDILLIAYGPTESVKFSLSYDPRYIKKVEVLPGNLSYDIDSFNNGSKDMEKGIVTNIYGTTKSINNSYTKIFATIIFTAEKLEKHTNISLFNISVENIYRHQIFKSPINGFVAISISPTLWENPLITAIIGASIGIVGTAIVVEIRRKITRKRDKVEKIENAKKVISEELSQIKKNIIGYQKIADKAKQNNKVFSPNLDLPTDCKNAIVNDGSFVLLQNKLQRKISHIYEVINRMKEIISDMKDIYRNKENIKEPMKDLLLESDKLNIQVEHVLIEIKKIKPLLKI